MHTNNRMSRKRWRTKNNNLHCNSLIQVSIWLMKFRLMNKCSSWRTIPFDDLFKAKITTHFSKIARLAVSYEIQVDCTIMKQQATSLMLYAYRLFKVKSCFVWCSSGKYLSSMFFLHWNRKWRMENGPFKRLIDCTFCIFRTASCWNRHSVIMNTKLRQQIQHITLQTKQTNISSLDIGRFIRFLHIFIYNHKHIVLRTEFIQSVNEQKNSFFC